MRLSPSRIALAVLLAAAPAAATRADAQETAARFEIVAVQDSTFSFLLGRQRWVAPTRTGIAVDPMTRDALVARFRVLSVRGDTAVALVTGAATRVTTQHVALIAVPEPTWWRSAVFWRGAALGALGGLGVGLLF